MPPPELLDILSFCAPFCYIFILTKVFKFVKGKAPNLFGAVSNSFIFVILLNNGVRRKTLQAGFA